jgi:hypothetical protein
MVAGINYPKIDVLKQHILHRSKSQKSKIGVIGNNPSVWRSLLPQMLLGPPSPLVAGSSDVP